MSRESGESGESEESRAALTANDEFYTAFGTGDAEAMDACWSKTEPVLCTHPGWQPIHGREEVIESWQRILENGPPSVRWSDGRVAIIRGVAFVSCIEWLIDGTLVATNVFVWEEGAWKLVHHHASPLAEQAQVQDEPPGRLH
jgi:ketosteroid isomerase-like protein